ncbi:hypothetical protein [Methylocella sp. CPCC 101449]|uniref:hypothetical protein n=1 Tax=Methylocella sp. CPCC 101449 TaxID=2987531 RepID=UPI00289003EB|nr:hypothetical protein [Methylocella sp. CPCC 101449]MDT2024528.1 hypothetical protein [Methylocella sp. CPCC 101449]
MTSLYGDYRLVREFSIFCPFLKRYEIAGFATPEKLKRMGDGAIANQNDWKYAELSTLVDGAIWVKPYLASFTDSSNYP